MANYANGNIGPHALLEMDEAASDVAKGIITLSDVAAQAGVNKLIGEESFWDLTSVVCLFVFLCALSNYCVSLLFRGAGCCGWTNPQPGEIGRVL